MEVAQSALWYVRECKESDDEREAMQRNSKAQEKRAEIKLVVRGKSSNHFVVLYVSVHINKTFYS